MGTNRVYNFSAGPSMLPLEEIVDLAYTTRTRRCGG